MRDWLATCANALTPRGCDLVPVFGPGILPPPGGFTVSYVGSRVEVDSVAFAPDGKTLASGCKDKTIKLWNVQTGELLRMLTGHTGRVESLTFSPDGRLLATGGGGGDTSVKLWSMSGSK